MNPNNITMPKYPKSCTCEEAIDCVKAGGKARLCGLSETWEQSASIEYRGGGVRAIWSDGNHVDSSLFNEAWLYEITEPATEYPRPCTVSEALVCVSCGGKAQVRGQLETEFLDLTVRNGFVGYVSSDGTFLTKIPDLWLARIVAPPIAPEYPKPCTRNEAVECVNGGGRAQLRGHRGEGWRDMYIHNSRVCYNIFGEHEYGLLSSWNYQITEPAPVKGVPAEPTTVSTAEAIAAVLAGATSAASATDGRRKVRMVTAYGKLRCISMEDNTVVGGIPVDERWVIKHKKPEPIKLEIRVRDKRDSIFDKAYEAIDDACFNWDGDLKVTCTVEAVD